MPFVKATAKDGRGPDWWVNVDRLAAISVADVTVRGHTGRAEQATEVTMFLPIAAPNGEAVVVRAYGEEADAILEAMERHRRAAA